MDIKKEKEFLCGFKLSERIKGKKIPGAGFLNGAAEPPRHCRGKGGETVEGSSAVALILPPHSLSLSPFRLSEVSPLHCVIEFVL